MLQSEWKRIVNEIEKAIQKATNAYKEYDKRNIQEHDAAVIVPLSNLVEQFSNYKEQQNIDSERRGRREKATDFLLQPPSPSSPPRFSTANCKR